LTGHLGLEHANRFDVKGPVHNCTVSMLLWEKPGEQRSGFFFDKIPDIFSKRTNQFRGNTAHQGQTHAVRNNPSHYLGVSAYRSIAQLALCGRLGASFLGTLLPICYLILSSERNKRPDRAMHLQQQRAQPVVLSHHA